MTIKIGSNKIEEIKLGNKHVNRVYWGEEIVYENFIPFVVDSPATYTQWITNAPNHDYTHVFIQNGNYGNNEQINLSNTGTKFITGESNNVHINARFKYNAINKQSRIKNLTLDGTNAVIDPYNYRLFENCCNLENIIITNYDDVQDGANNAAANYMFYKCNNLHNIIIENCKLGGRDVGSHWRSFCGVQNLDGLIIRNNILKDTGPYNFYAVFRSYGEHTCKNINNVLIENNTGKKMLLVEKNNLRLSNFSNMVIKIDGFNEFYGLEGVDGVDNVKICVSGGKSAGSQINNCNEVSNCKLTSGYSTYVNCNNISGQAIGSNGDGNTNTVSSNPCVG
ncbi:MAG: hypothetical protein LBU40_00290 [Methanobrevibacter sp.]|jgi:hypothetical protein|nr:hypothetical protein [Methanobrevibacter sp.]